MKEKTRKTLAIVLLGIGVFVPFVMNYVPTEWKWFAADFFDIDFEDIDHLEVMSYVLLASFGSLISGCFLFAGIWVLKKLLNAVTRRFFYRLFIGLFIWFAGYLVIDWIWILSEVLVRISHLIDLAAVIILMSGAGIISRNYTLDAYLSSKLRLFQTGVVLWFVEIALTVLSGLRVFVGYVENLAPISVYPMNQLINAIGCVCLFLGLVGIIRSDLLSEERRADVFGEVGGGWFSRPVIGGVCFNVFLLIVVISSSAVLGNL